MDRFRFSLGYIQLIDWLYILYISEGAIKIRHLIVLRILLFCRIFKVLISSYRTLENIYFKVRINGVG